MDIIKIAVVLVVLGFIAELFFFNGGFTNLNSAKPVPTDSNVSGIGTFKGTIRTYDPILYVPTSTSQSIIDAVKKNPAVKDVQTNSQGIFFELVTRDDVYPVATQLMSLGVTPLAIANIALDQGTLQTTSVGTISVIVPAGAIKVITEPIVDVDTEVTVSLSGVASGNTLIAYDTNSVKLLSTPFALVANATVSSLASKVYQYDVPWENRSALGNLSQYGQVDYKRFDTIVFQVPLTADQQVALKSNVPYIVYVSDTSAQIDPAFSDIEQLKKDFSAVQYSLPASKLTILTNDTPNLPIQLSATLVSYSYVLSVNDSAVPAQAKLLKLETDKEYAINSTVIVNITGLEVGNKLVQFKYGVLPS